MDIQFCRRCGTALTADKEHSYTCANGHKIFASPVPAVGVFFLTRDNHIILSVRGREPRKGMLDAFGGFVDQGETMEQAAVRELQEELGLEADEYEPLHYLLTGVGHYPYGGETIPVVSGLFWTRLHSDTQLRPADDVAATRTLPLHEVDPAALHDDDIRAGVRALQDLYNGNE